MTFIKPRLPRDIRLLCRSSFGLRLAELAMILMLPIAIADVSGRERFAASVCLVSSVVGVSLIRIAHIRLRAISTKSSMKEGPATGRTYVDDYEAHQLGIDH